MLTLGSKGCAAWQVPVDTEDFDAVKGGSLRRLALGQTWK